jgi:hypothetical protein
MILFKTLFSLLCVTLLVAASDAQSQLPPNGGVAPLTKIPSEQWIQKVVGDMDQPGEPSAFTMTLATSYCRTRIQRTRTSRC